LKKIRALIEREDFHKLEMLIAEEINKRTDRQNLILLSAVNSMMYVHFQKTNSSASENFFKKVNKHIEREKTSADFIEECGSELKGNYARNKDIAIALDYIANNLDKKLTLEELSSRVHLSKNYFSNLFKKITGSCFSTYVNDKRIEKAKELLKEDYSLAHIAQLCGYSSQNYFHTQFQKRTGTTPNKYRRRYL
jgi:YesN/AraC family two-component response regulator